MLYIWFSTVFGFRSYHRLRTLGPWRTAFFLLYLLLVGVLVFNLYFAFQLHKQLPVFMEQLAPLTFEKGRLTGPEQALTVSVPKTPYVLIFDTYATTPPTPQEFLDKKIMAFVAQDQFYMPSITGISAQPLPHQLNGSVDAAILQKYLPIIRNFLQSMAFLGAFFVLGFFLVFSILLAAAVLFFWSALKRTTLSRGVLARWAVFLQGPALVLWLVQLFCGVPLFTFALFILFNIYVQQVFNTLPPTGDKKYAA